MRSYKWNRYETMTYVKYPFIWIYNNQGMLNKNSLLPNYCLIILTPFQKYPSVVDFQLSLHSLWGHDWQYQSQQLHCAGLFQVKFLWCFLRLEEGTILFPSFLSLCVWVGILRNTNKPSHCFPQVTSSSTWVFLNEVLMWVLAGFMQVLCLSFRK